MISQFTELKITGDKIEDSQHIGASIFQKLKMLITLICSLRSICVYQITIHKYKYYVG